MALPRKGFSGVENTVDTMACTNNMAESGGGGVKEEQRESQRHLNLTKPVKYVKSGTRCVFRIRGTANGWAKAWKAEPQVICHGAM